jgi:hypothetical protein
MLIIHIPKEKELLFRKLLARHRRVLVSFAALPAPPATHAEQTRRHTHEREP